MEVRKARGADGVLNTVRELMLKAGGDVTTETLTHDLHRNMRRRRNTWLLEDWHNRQTAVIIWRGITLLSSTSRKVFSREIPNRISTCIDPILRKVQGGFRKGRSCGALIFPLRQILEFEKTLCYINSIEFETFFDSIDT